MPLALTIAAFNLGNAIGAWLGGVAIDMKLGYTAPNWVGAMLVTAGLAATLLSGALDRGSDRRRAARGPDSTTDSTVETAGVGGTAVC